MDFIKVAVVILNWNGKSFLQEFLPNVIRYNPDYARIVVADNGSSDGSLEFLQAHFPKIEVLDLKANHGYTGGYNHALQQIKAQYYVLLNSDIAVSEGWIGSIIDEMDREEGIAACQPKILSYHQPEFFEYAGASGGFIDYLGYPFCRGRIFEHTEKDLGQYDDITEVFWATGACLFVRAKDFHSVGGFDNDFFAHMEEIDLCWRLKRMGKTIKCVPQSVVYHVGGGTLPRNNPRKTFLNFRNNMLLLAKNMPAKIFYPVFLQRIILDELAAVLFLVKGQYKDFLAVYKATFSVLYFLRRKRKEGKALPYQQPHPVYCKSIVAAYFLKGKKQFTQLKQSAFRYTV